MKGFSWHVLVTWFKQDPIKKISQVLLAISVFCFPFQIRTLFFSPDIFISGNFNPFTAVFLSFNNLVVLAAGFFYGLWLLRKKIFLKKISQDFFWWWILFFITLIFVSFWAFNAEVHWYLTMHWLIMFVWFLLLVSDLLPWNIKLQCFVASMVFESILGITQYVFQTSIGLGRLGEPVLNAQAPGIAKLDWMGMKFIRPYGTFPHTNVLAGSIVFALFAGVYVFQKSRRTIILSTLFFGMALILTFSRSAWLGFLVALIFVFAFTKIKHKLAVFAAVLILVVGVCLTQLQGPLVSRILGSDGQSSVERELYMDISRKMFFEYPFGVGLGNFTLQMVNFTDQKLAPWIVQPVHNIYMLVTNELGIQGILLFLLLIGHLIYMVSQERSELKIALLFSFLVIGLFDHYFFTLEQGQFLFIFMVAYLCYVEKKEAFPRMKS